MFDFLYSGMGWVLKQLYLFVHDVLNFDSTAFALAIILLTVLINLILLPLNFYQQKSQSKQTALKPKLDELKKQCGDDKQKYNTMMQELYKKEGVKMFGGCLPLLIRLPFLWAVWQAIRCPLQYIVGVDINVINTAKEAIVNAGIESNIAKVTDLHIISNFDVVKNVIPVDIQAKIQEISFHVFGVDLAATPKFSLNFTSEDVVLVLWIFPILSFVTAFVSSLVSMKMQKKTNPDAAQMGGMMLMMPIVSLVIAFGVPCAVGFYWACSNVVNMIITICLNKWYGPYSVIARDERKVIKQRRAIENGIKLSE